MGGWMDGWVDVWESGVKDCLQQSKTEKNLSLDCTILALIFFLRVSSMERHSKK
jgi:hypothetical protein